MLGFVGQLHTSKRYDRLLTAATPLLRYGAWLLLVGDGPERPRLVQLAREIAISRCLVFAGERDDVTRMLSAMDLFVSPSEEETSGLRVVAANYPTLDAVSLSGVRRIPQTCPRYAKPCSRKGFWAPTLTMY